MCTRMRQHRMICPSRRRCIGERRRHRRRRNGHVFPPVAYWSIPIIWQAGRPTFSRRIIERRALMIRAIPTVTINGSHVNWIHARARNAAKYYSATRRISFIVKLTREMSDNAGSVASTTMTSRSTLSPNTAIRSSAVQASR